jgi:diadenosine tetraphosphatase ApaH/serine/threonine PP2A family protein phosphatase
LIRAILSDVHANLEALTVVLAEIERQRVEEIYCLGDLVGYGADPNQVVEIAIEKRFHCLIGNHDQVACGLEEPYYFNPHARQAALWTREQLTEANKQYLKDLPFKLDVSDDSLAVHGSLERVDEYILDFATAKANFHLLKAAGKRACFFGHSHYRVTIVQDGDRVMVDNDEQLELTRDKLYLINPGSVGQPRDGDPRAGFAIYDDEADRVTFCRLKYDIDTASRKILQAGLSPYLADRLSLGR